MPDDKSTETKSSSTKKPSADKRIAELEQKLDNMLECLILVGTLTGNSAALLKHKYTPWVPGKDDIKRYSE